MTTAEAIADWIAVYWWVLLIIAVALIILVTIWAIWKGRRAPMEDHVRMYFDDHFKDIIKEWDLVTTPSLKKWKKTLTDRLGKVTKDIDTVESYRRSIDPRLTALESDLDGLEGA